MLNLPERPCQVRSNRWFSLTLFRWSALISGPTAAWISGYLSQARTSWTLANADKPALSTIARARTA